MQRALTCLGMSFLLLPPALAEPDPAPEEAAALMAALTALADAHVRSATSAFHNGTTALLNATSIVETQTSSFPCTIHIYSPPCVACVQSTSTFDPGRLSLPGKVQPQIQYRAVTFEYPGVRYWHGLPQAGMWIHTIRVVQHLECP